MDSSSVDVLRIDIVLVCLFSFSESQVWGKLLHLFSSYRIWKQKTMSYLGNLGLELDFWW